MYKRSIINLFAVSVVFLFCTACSMNSQSSKEQMFATYANQGFQKNIIRTSTFDIFALLRPASMISDTLHVYIEGDGRAWISRRRVSNNPTPVRSTTFDVAKKDPSTNAILYLARPCQYTTSDSLCSPKYWTSHRLSSEVITALNESIDKIKIKTQSKKIVLIGYSGGGPAAVLIASRRSDVVFLGSFAGNIDINKWTSWHKVSPLIGSQDPMQVAHSLSSIPQRHLTSFDDSIVPPAINKNFCDIIQKENSCICIQGVEHSDDWYKVWDYNYKKIEKTTAQHP